MTESLLSILLILGIGLIPAILVNYATLKWGIRQGSKMQQNQLDDRWAKTFKPAVGGISLFLVFFIGFLAWLIITQAGNFLSIDQKVIGLLIGSIIGFSIGLFDDLKHASPAVKFGGQFATAIVMVLFGLVIPISPFWGLNCVVTVLWIVGLMNSINMLDNMDGITTSVSIIIVLACISSAVLLYNQSIDTPALFFTSVLLLSLIGFLFFNWNPSKMFMGDAGSQFLGAFIAGISILYLWNVRDPLARGIQVKQFIIPALVFIIPLTDTVTVFFRRIASGKSPFQGGKDHTTHHLVYAGFKEKQVALIFILVSFLAGVLALTAMYYQAEWKYWYTGLLILFYIIVFLGIQFFYIKGANKNI